MKTIKIIELLNKIANGEDVPEKIKYRDEIFYYKEDMTNYSKGEHYYLFDRGFRHKTETFLNTEIEIIEDTDKKIEKIPHLFYHEEESEEMNSLELFMIQNQHTMISKMNEIIDYINKEN